LTFGNSILAGEELVRTGVRSPNYAAGVSGWRIARDGSAEFNNVTVRGSLFTRNPSGAYVQIFASGSLAAIDLQPPDDPDETFDNGTIYADTDGLDTPFLQIQSPIIVGEDNSVITLYGENSADGLLPAMQLRVRGGFVNINDGDLRVDNDSIGRGALVGGRQVETTNDGPFTADSATDFTRTLDVIAGRTYAHVLQGLGELSAATGAWQLNLEVGGVYADTFTRLTNETATLTRKPINGLVLWTAPATATVTFTVMADERAGTADLTLIGGNSATSPPRTYAVLDAGVF